MLGAAKVEVMLFEASGAFANRDTAKHAYDLIKGAFGCTAMIKTILAKYPYANRELLHSISAIFVQASGKDDCVRTWLMKPAGNGDLVTFERVQKARFSVNAKDRASIREIIDFFFTLKNLIEKSVASITALKESHDDHVLDGTRSGVRLDDMLKPTPLKPKKTQGHYGKISVLDPPSFTYPSSDSA
ncbi:hypothetical protein BJV82DRAFT_55967 [Fennellomyces sp. T-0311]|nr:hypothetical protein BJV82DRAFT_55967 [Fennellomyces sp. T-0311]